MNEELEVLADLAKYKISLALAATFDDLENAKSVARIKVKLLMQTTLIGGTAQHEGNGMKQ